MRRVGVGERARDRGVDRRRDRARPRRGSGCTRGSPPPPSVPVRAAIARELVDVVDAMLEREPRARACRTPAARSVPIADHEHAERLEHARACAADRGSPSRRPTRRRSACARARRDRARRRRLSPRCTPPMPPVANTRMPARAASAHGRAHRGRRVAAARDVHGEIGRAGLRERRAVAREPLERCRASSPMRGSPSTTAIVAGTAPPARTAASSSRATSRLSGHGRPCATSVDSSATIGPRAAATSADSTSLITRIVASSAATPRPSCA